MVEQKTVNLLVVGSSPTWKVLTLGQLRMRGAELGVVDEQM